MKLCLTDASLENVTSKEHAFFSSSELTTRHTPSPLVEKTQRPTYSISKPQQNNEGKYHLCCFCSLNFFPVVFVKQHFCTNIYFFKSFCINTAYTPNKTMYI